jgi:hypothetical protein
MAEKKKVQKVPVKDGNEPATKGGLNEVQKHLLQILGEMRKIEDRSKNIFGDMVRDIIRGGCQNEHDMVTLLAPVEATMMQEIWDARQKDIISLAGSKDEAESLIRKTETEYFWTATTKKHVKGEFKTTWLPMAWHSSKSVISNCFKNGVPLLDQNGMPYGKSELERMTRKSKEADRFAAQEKVWEEKKAAFASGDVVPDKTTFAIEADLNSPEKTTLDKLQIVLQAAKILLNNLKAAPEDVQEQAAEMVKKYLIDTTPIKVPFNAVFSAIPEGEAPRRRGTDKVLTPANH